MENRQQGGHQHGRNNQGNRPIPNADRLISDGSAVDLEPVWE
jgi:hypothetical protein